MSDDDKILEPQFSHTRGEVMGSRTEADIAAWQKAAGIEPASGGRADLLRRISNLAFELIKVIELERSGIRDGDGMWHGSDAVGGTMIDLVQLIENFLQPDRAKPLPSEVCFDEPPPWAKP
jgi:hypothetical protein